MNTENIVRFCRGLPSPHFKNLSNQAALTTNRHRVVSENGFSYLERSRPLLFFGLYMSEEWVWVKGYEGLYMVSSTGRFKSFSGPKEKMVKPYKIGKKQPRLQICFSLLGKKIRRYAHAVVAEAFIGERPVGCVVDHINGDPLDNRAANLRYATHNQNSMNSKKQSRSCLSRYKGVTFCKRKKRWAARIQLDGKHYRNGTYKTQEEAALAYNALALKHFGEFARLNIITQEGA